MSDILKKVFGSTENRTPIAGFKVLSATDYTMEPSESPASRRYIYNLSKFDRISGYTGNRKLFRINHIGVIRDMAGTVFLMPSMWKGNVPQKW